MDANEIKQLRIRAGLSQGKLALFLGVSEKTIRRWESGESRPANYFPVMEKIKKLAEEGKS